MSPAVQNAVMRPPRCRPAATVAAIVLGLALPPIARAAAPVRCAIPAYSVDPDPRGANLRAGPGQAFPVVGRLPPPMRDGEERVAAEFEVAASQDGWLLIRNATQGGYGGATRRAVFAGPAWLSARLVGFTINDPGLRAAPALGAGLVAALRGTLAGGEAWGPDAVTIEQVHACDGRFADVALRLPTGRRVRGWATGLCSNQVTTCP